MTIYFNEIKNSSSFCIAAFTHTNFTIDGKVSPCCLAEPLEKGIEDFENIWTGSSYVELRKKMLEGTRPLECWRCWQIEDKKGYSDRQIHNNTFLKDNNENLDIDVIKGNTTGFPLWLDIRPGRFCNLKCRMCYSGNSSQIKEEIYLQNKADQDIIGDRPEEFDDWIDNPAAFQIMKKLIPNIKTIKIAGGEPLFMQGVIKLFEWCIQTGNTHLCVDITTNGTRNTGKVINYCKAFKKVHMNVSIDAIGNLNNYIRGNSKWSDVSSSLRLYNNLNWSINIMVTVQLYNIHYISRLISWWAVNYRKCKLVFNIVNEPKDMKIDLLDLQERFKIKEEILFAIKNHNITDKEIFISRLSVVLEMLEENLICSNLDGLRKKFVNRSNVLDRIRKESLQDTNIKLFNCIKEWQ